MAELCTAFSRIVPRYQFAPNQAALIVEDMKHSPAARQRVPCHAVRKTGGCDHPFAHYQSHVTLRPRCHRTPTTHPKWCSSMDTCGNWKDKVCYYHTLF